MLVAQRSRGVRWWRSSDVGGVVDRVARLEANAKHCADDLHDAANRLGDVFRDKRDKNNSAVRDQVDKTLAAASELNRVMTNHSSLYRQAAARLGYARFGFERPGAGLRAVSAGGRRELGHE